MDKEKFEIHEKFSHLWKMSPEVSKIIDINPSDVDDKQLWFLDGHLEWLQIKFPEISQEIDITRWKIKLAMWLKPNNIPEILNSSKDNYSNNREYRPVYSDKKSA